MKQDDYDPNGRKVVVLGAGISGISAAYHLGQSGYETVVYEKDADWGGLCGNFTVDGFRFDKAVHLSFARNKYVQELFEKSTDLYRHRPHAFNYYEGHWLKHPAQNNLSPLPAEEKVKIISDFVRNRDRSARPENYEQWLRAQYGDYFSENFPMRYTRKYWTMDAEALSTSWVGNRMYKPDIEEVLAGSYSTDTPNTYYAEEMRYPKTGGYKSFLRVMSEDTDIRVNKEVVRIDPDSRMVYFSDGESVSYDFLVSSLPLPLIVTLIDGIPDAVRAAGEKLFASSVALVSLGFNDPDVAKYLWYYIYDEDFLSARCYSPSLKSPDNAPEGCSSLQFEIYFSRHKPLPVPLDELAGHIIEKGSQMGLFDPSKIAAQDVRVLPYGNVVFYRGMEDDREVVLNYLDSIDVYRVGRFGRWEYLWSDQSLLSGKNVKLKKRCHE